MSASVRFVSSMADQAQASRLRHDIEDILAGRFGGQERVTGRRGGRTMLASLHDRPVGSVDVHWGGDAPLPPRLVSDLDLTSALADVDPRQVVVLDTLLVHPDWRGRQLEPLLLEGAVRFAIEQGARLVYGETDATGSADYRALGFTSVGLPRMRDTGPVVSMQLDLHDVDHLEQVGSPFLAIVRARLDTLDDAHEPTEAEEPRWRRLVRSLRAHGETGGLFTGLTDGEIETLVALSKLGRLPRGHKVVADGGRGSDLFVVVEGEVDVRRDGRTLARLGPGHVVGEVGFLLDGVRSADVVARSDDAVLLRIPGRELRELMEGDPELGLRLALGLGRAAALKLLDHDRAG